MSKKKINILFVTPWLFVGGAERTFIDVMTRLDPERFNVKLMVMDDAGTEAKIWKKELASRHIEILSIARTKITWLGKIGGAIKALQLMAAMYRVFRRERPDIVHLQLFADIYGRFIARLARVPIIVSSENNVNIDEPKWQSVIKRLTNCFVDHFIAISEAVAVDAIKRYGLTSSSVTTITTGINVKKYAVDPAARNNRSGTFRFGAMGRLSEQKGFSTLIEAAALLNSLDFECLIAGDGPLRGELEKQITQAGLEKRVKLVGIQEDTPRFFENLDCFVMPSWWEGLGLVVLEAGASGLPVIASNVGGLKQSLTDGQTGRLVAPKDPAALAAVMKEAITHRASAEWTALGERLQRRVRTDFSIDANIPRYEAVYEHLIATR